MSTSASRSPSPGLPRYAASEQAPLVVLPEERYRYPTEPISWGDEVLLDLAGYSQGHLMPFSLRTEVWLTVQPEPLLPGLYESLVGRSPGEGLAVDLTVPESYPLESLRGIPARFVVHIRAARQVTSPGVELPPELVDEERHHCWSATEGRSSSELQLDGLHEEESLTSWLEETGALRTGPEPLARLDDVAWHLMTVDPVMSRTHIHIEGA